MIVPACSTRRVPEMPPLGCWLACPVIWKLVLAYHNSAINMRFYVWLGAQVEAFGCATVPPVLVYKSLEMPKKKGRPKQLFYYYNPIQLFGHLGPGCRLVVFLEGNRQNRPE